MAFPDYDAALHRALEICGVQADYWDIFGKQRRATHQTKAAILSALGIDCSNQESLERSIDCQILDIVGRVLPPCSVIGQSGHIDVHIPADHRCAVLRLRIDWEDGRVSNTQVALQSLKVTGETEVQSRRFVRFSVPVSTFCGGEWHLGYHRVSAAFCDELYSMWLIATPERAWLPPALEHGARSAGLGVQLYGIRSPRNWGCGDFTDLRGVASWAAALRASFIALNPLHAIHNRSPYNTSPYLPFSLLYRNFIYLDVERLPEFQQCPWAVRQLGSEAVQQELAELRASDFVPYERVAALKLRFLRRIFVHGKRTGAIDMPALRAWIEREGEGLQRFATYCALDEYIHRRHPEAWIYPDWPKQYQDPNSPAVAEFRKRHARNIEFFCYLQWRIDQQAAQAQVEVRQTGVPIGLYHDLPLATDRYGCELWGHGEFYVNGCRVGSPPDDFSPTGQDWGFPPPTASSTAQAAIATTWTRFAPRSGTAAPCASTTSCASSAFTGFPTASTPVAARTSATTGKT